MNILIYSTSNPATFGGLHFVTLQMKGERTKIIPTQNQPLRKTYECVGFGAKLTSSEDKEDDKSIASHPEHGKEAGENPKPRFHCVNFLFSGFRGNFKAVRRCDWVFIEALVILLTQMVSFACIFYEN